MHQRVVIHCRNDGNFMQTISGYVFYRFFSQLQERTSKLLNTSQICSFLRGKNAQNALFTSKNWLFDVLLRKTPPKIHSSNIQFVRSLCDEKTVWFRTNSQLSTFVEMKTLQSTLFQITKNVSFAKESIKLSLLV